MKYLRFVISFTLFIGSLLFLTACASETETPPQSIEEPYPYPDSGEEVVSPAEPLEPYPDPDIAVVIDPLAFIGLTCNLQVWKERSLEMSA